MTTTSASTQHANHADLKEVNKPRPQLKHMTVSVNREKSPKEYHVFNAHIPLYRLHEGWSEGIQDPEDALYINDLDYEAFEAHVQDMLKVNLKKSGFYIIWRVSETGQLGHVHDKISCEAAVLSHQNSGKSTVQLYLARKPGYGPFQIDENFPNCR